MNSSPFFGIVQETHEVFPIDSRQFTVDDNESIRYANQNRERVFGIRYPVHDPPFVLEVLHNGFAKSAIVRNNESCTKVWQLHWSDGDWGRGVIALAGPTRQPNYTISMQGMSSVRGKAPEWNFDFSVGVPNGMPAEKSSEGPNIGSNFSRMD